MSLILNIDTALDTASVCLANGEEILQLSFNKNQKDHAAWLHTTIAETLKKNGIAANQLEAIGVTIGPGSYTGLRVGLAAAKGLCFALKIPLIAISTLEVIAYSVKNEAENIICPMIDARRMEVFAAVYDKSMNEKIPAHSLIIDETSFASELISGKVLFCGNGSKKLQALITDKNANFSTVVHTASHLAALSMLRYQKKEFADLAYIEPLYGKEFFTPPRKS